MGGIIIITHPFHAAKVMQRIREIERRQLHILIDLRNCMQIEW